MIPFLVLFDIFIFIIIFVIFALKHIATQHAALATFYLLLRVVSFLVERRYSGTHSLDLMRRGGWVVEVIFT
jgi:hypothetical protein